MTTPAARLPLIMRPLAHADLEFVMAQHHANFPENAFGRLGDDFLRRYYATFVDSPNASALLATNGGSPAGYLVGIEDTHAHRAWMRRHCAPSLSMALLRSLCRRRQLANQLWRSRQVRRRAAHQAVSQSRTSSPVGPVAVLSHLVVLPEHQGSGVGRSLVDIFIDGATAAGAARIAVATAESNVAAARLYEGRGWLLETRRTMFDGRVIRIYDKPLVGSGN